VYVREKEKERERERDGDGASDDALLAQRHCQVLPTMEANIRQI